jgi:hypothetical protein
MNAEFFSYEALFNPRKSQAILIKALQSMLNIVAIARGCWALGLNNRHPLADGIGLWVINMINQTVYAPAPVMSNSDEMLDF